jgi:WD40 repeat protein
VRGHDNKCWDVAVSLDGELVATASNALVAWNVAKRSVQYRHPVEEATGGRSLCFDERGEWLLSGGHDGARVLDARTGKILYEYPESGTVLSHGDWLVIAGHSGRVELWSRDGDEPADTIALDSRLALPNHAVACFEGCLWIGTDDARLHVYELPPERPTMAR